jgi:translation initiation factor IF-3
LTLIKNQQIQSKYVKLIENEKMVGIVALNDALFRARQKNLDLVVITEGAGTDYPICKILDADSYRYNLEKQQKALAKRQRELTVETKEIQLRPVTDQNDINVKVKNALRFLNDGDKVKVILKFKGREKSNKSLGFNVMNKFLETLGEHKIEKPLSDTGNDLLLILAPLISKSEKHKEKNVS